MTRLRGSSALCPTIPAMELPSPDLQRRAEALLKKRPTSWRCIERGYTPAQRWLVTFDDGSSAFLKVGDDVERAGAAHTPAEGLRKEYRVYSQLSAPFLPRMLAWLDEPGATILALEDLGAAFWPPPWTQSHVNAVLEALAALHATRLPDATSVFENIETDPTPGGWAEVAREPSPFLSLGLAGRPGSISLCPSCSQPAMRSASAAKTSATGMCAATTSASAATKPSSSTGTGQPSATAISIPHSGYPASKWKAARHQSRRCLVLLTSQQWSAASSPHAQAYR